MSEYHAMETLLAQLQNVTEEGHNVDAYAEILYGPTTVPIRNLTITRQDARASQLGDYYEIHGRYGFIAILRGSLDILLDGCPLHLHGGQAFMHFPFQTHFFVRESADALMALFVFDCTDDTGWCNLRRCVFDMPTGWEDSLSGVIGAWLAKDAQAAALALHEHLHACACLFRTKAASETPLLARLTRLLNAPGNYLLRVKELAWLLGCTPNHLNSSFRKAYGVPLGSYLEHRRFGLAVSLLSDPALTVKEIAVRTGFLTESAFCRKMRIWSGLSPMECRQILLSPHPSNPLHPLRAIYPAECVMRQTRVWWEGASLI